MSETKSQLIEEFYQYLFGVIKLHRDLIPKLKDELMLIESGSVEALTENINRQQSFVLQTSRFDQDVKKYMEALNLKGNNITEVVAQLPEEYRLRFYGLIGEFEETVKEMNFYKEKCKSLLDLKLHTVEQKLNTYENRNVNKLYSQDGKKESNISLPKTLEKKI
ncbi:flagellar export chaperone FlgN [Eubacteriaceae bacterium ES3]|nr:flagellar export chaperone FlgN [Eubacteriaceae bacterium ES3]